MSREDSKLFVIKFLHQLFIVGLSLSIYPSLFWIPERAKERVGTVLLFQAHRFKIISDLRAFRARLPTSLAQTSIGTLRMISIKSELILKGFRQCKVKNEPCTL